MSSPAVRPLAPSETFGVKAVHDPSLRRGDRPSAGQRWESEAQFQRRVTDVATLRGWRWFHDNDSRRNKAGLPDILALRRGRFLVAEVKTETGRLRPDQVRWLDGFREVRGVEVHVWRPSDWDLIVEVAA